MHQHEFCSGDLIEDRKSGLIGLVYGYHEIYYRVWWIDNSRGYRKSLVSPSDNRVRALRWERNDGESDVV
mgnify:CR=1 FL=1|jgi:hypothetical protein